MRKTIILMSALLMYLYGYGASALVDGISWTYEGSRLENFYLYGGYNNQFRPVISSLTEGPIVIPSKLGDYTIITLGVKSFYNCKKITDVTIPDSVVNVSDSAFSGCSSITNVFALNVKHIDQSAFNNCTSLTSIALGSVTNIGSSAFSGCYSLRSITLGKDLVKLGGHPYPSFSGCTRVTDVTVPGWQCTIPFDSVTNLVISDGTLCISNSAFTGCNSLVSVAIPDSVVSVGAYAFKGCGLIRNITIPNSVTNVGASAFADCGSLTNAVILGRGLYQSDMGNGITYSSSPFRNCSNLVSVTTMDTCPYMFYQCDKMESVTLLEGMSEIGGCAFLRCKLLTNVVIPNSVSAIGQSSFSGCSSLESITMSDNIKSIGASAFASCSSLLDIAGLPQIACTKTMAEIFPASYQTMTNIVVADGVTRISADCFNGCLGLKRIVIPASVSVIYDNAFKDCVSLEEIVFLGDAPDVGSEILLGTPRTLKIMVKEGSIGWKGGVSTDLPVVWPVGDATAREIKYSGSNDSPEGGGSSGGESAIVDARYDLADDVADRAIANVEIDGDAAIDSFVLKDGKVYDSVVRIVNTSASAAKISLPGGFIYEKFKGTKPLEIPATSTNLLTITRTKGDTFLLSREELVLEVQE